MPRMLGQTDRGEPIVEVRAVRMVLRGDANYFSRLVTCTNCGREVPGLPVTGPADLEIRPGPYVCTECVETLRSQGAPPPAPLADDGAMAGLQARIDELAGRLDAGAAAGPARVDALDARLDQLEQRLAADAEAGAGQQEGLEARLQELEQQVAAGVDADRRAAQLESRLAQLEAAADQRLATVDRTIEAQREEMRTALKEGLEEVRAAAAAPAETRDRLHALEKQATRNRSDMAELGELHAALDAGLGALRAEIGEVRSSVKRVADGHAELDDRLETYVRVSMSPEEQGKGRRSGRKGGDGDRVTTMAAAIDDILREQRVLRDQVAALAQASDAATATAGRAASQASALSTLRGEIKLLQQEIAEQNEVVEALRKAAERPAPAPAEHAPAAAAKAPAAKKATRAKRA